MAGVTKCGMMDGIARAICMQRMGSIFAQESYWRCWPETQERSNDPRSPSLEHKGVLARLESNWIRMSSLDWVGLPGIKMTKVEIGIYLKTIYYCGRAFSQGLQVGPWNPELGWRMLYCLDVVGNCRSNWGIARQATGCGDDVTTCSWS